MSAPYTVRAWAASSLAVPSLEDPIQSFNLAIEVSNRMAERVAVSKSSLVFTAAHSIELGHLHISFGDVSQDQKILAANQNSDLSDYHYYP